MDPWKSWTIVGILGAGAAYYYSQSGKSKTGRSPTSSVLANQSQPRGSASTNDTTNTRKKKSRGKAPDASDRDPSNPAEASFSSAKGSSIEKVKKGRDGKQQASKLTQSSTAAVSGIPEVEVGADDGEDEVMSNTEFAMQLSGLKTGTSLKKADLASKDHKKTKKQGKSSEMLPEMNNGTIHKPNEISHTQEASTASSTTGVAADDDLSLPVSPEFGASQATTPSGGDISDMLEKPVKRPIILHLTEPTNQQPARQPKAQKPKAEPETKKQRQNRQKNDEKKAVREQAEKERRVLLENQLRTAREADGRAAKNGLGGSTAPSTSAWDKSTVSAAGATVSSAPVPPKPHDGPLLDTFEEDKSFLGDAPQVNGGARDTSKDRPPNGVLNNVSTDGKAKDGANLQSTDGTTSGKDTNAPFDEEQVNSFSKMNGDDTWKTVSKAKGKRRSTTVTSAVNSNRTQLSRSSKNPTATDNRSSLSATTNNSATNDHSPSISAQTSSEMDDADLSPTAAETVVLANLRNDENEHKDKSRATDIKSPEDPRTRFPHLDFEGGTFKSEDINDKGVSKYFRGKLTSNGEPDYSDPDYPRNWVPGMSVHDIYRRRPKHLGFRDDGVTMKETFETIDHDAWTRENIQDHPDYDPAWPYALTGHPMDSEWLGDWNSSDIGTADEKRATRADIEEDKRKTPSKENEGVEEHADDY